MSDTGLFAKSGSGNASGSSGGAATITDTGTFGKQAAAGQSATTPSPITATKAGGTKGMGYEDPAQGHGGIRGAMLQPVAAPQPQGRQLNTDEPFARGNVTPEGIKHAIDQLGEHLGRNDEFNYGATSSLPKAAEAAEGADLADAALAAL